MKFCSNCGHIVLLKEIEGDNIPRFYFINCETIHYQNPNMIVACLPIWSDKVLLAKRAILDSFELALVLLKKTPIKQ